MKEFISGPRPVACLKATLKKYALSRGYSQVDILKLKERINQVKSPSPKANSKAEAKDDSRTINSEGAGDTNEKKVRIKKWK